jgi:hypothetical protein
MCLQYFAMLPQGKVCIHVGCTNRYCTFVAGQGSQTATDVASNYFHRDARSGNPVSIHLWMNMSWRWIMVSVGTFSILHHDCMDCLPR